MKSLYIAIICIIFQNTLSSQSYLISYAEEKVITDELKSKLLKTMTEERIQNFFSTKRIYSLNIDNNGNSKFAYDTIIYINDKYKTSIKNVMKLVVYKNSVLKNVAIIDVMNEINTATIKNKLTASDWLVTGKKKKIGDFLAYEAVLKNKKNKVTAYFAPSIAISEGPWEYCGLPGLIIELNLENLNYKLNSFKSLKNDKFNCLSPKPLIILSETDFETYKSGKIASAKSF
jgi:GLPGLI family protein